MNHFILCFMLFFSSVTHAQNSMNSSLSDCRKNHFGDYDKTKFLTCATSEDFYMPNWCEKMKIPYNKVSEKPNIFLPITNDELEKIDLDESDAENEVIENEVIENLCLVIENELL